MNKKLISAAIAIGVLTFGSMGTTPTFALTTPVAKTLFDKTANNLGISSEELITALEVAEKEVIDDNAENGIITSKQASQIKQKIDSTEPIEDELTGSSSDNDRED